MLYKVLVEIKKTGCLVVDARNEDEAQIKSHDFLNEQGSVDLEQTDMDIEINIHKSNIFASSEEDVDEDKEINTALDTRDYMDGEDDSHVE